MKKILIQANNLSTVVDVFMFIYLHPGCKKQDVANYCGFSLRQVDYYTNACKYLDLIDDEWKSTDLANDIFQNHPAEVTECVYKRIIDDEVIGQIYAKLQEEPDSYPSEYAKTLVEDYFPGYSDAVYDRRSDNMIKWCKKIMQYFSNK